MGRPYPFHRQTRPQRRSVMDLILVIFSVSFSLASGLECGSPGDVFPHETDCGSYYYCDRLNQLRKFSCPEGQRYDQENEICVIYDNGKCIHSPTEANTGEESDHVTTDQDDLIGTKILPGFNADDLKEILYRLSMVKEQSESNNGEGESNNKDSELVSNDEKLNNNEEDSNNSGGESSNAEEDSNNNEGKSLVQDSIVGDSENGEIEEYPRPPIENPAHVEKREIDAAEIDTAKNEGEGVEDSETLEETKDEDDSQHNNSASTQEEESEKETVTGGITGDENVEVDVDEVVKSEVQTEQKEELFPPSPFFHPGNYNVPLSKGEKDKPSAMYGYADDIKDQGYSEKKDDNDTDFHKIGEDHNPDEKISQSHEVENREENNEHQNISKVLEEEKEDNHDVLEVKEAGLEAIDGGANDEHTEDNPEVAKAELPVNQAEAQINQESHEVEDHENIGSPTQADGEDHQESHKEEDLNNTAKQQEHSETEAGKPEDTNEAKGDEVVESSERSSDEEKTEDKQKNEPEIEE